MVKGASNVENVSMQIPGVLTSDDKYCGDSGRTKVGDKKLMGTL